MTAYTEEDLRAMPTSEIIGLMAELTLNPEAELSKDFELKRGDQSSEVSFYKILRSLPHF